MTDAPDQHSALDARDDLLAIAAAWPDLEDRLGREGGGPSDGMPRAVTPTRGLVINEHISEIMREVREWVAFLARVLMDEVRVDLPTRGEDGEVFTSPWAPANTDTAAMLGEIARTRIGHFTSHADEQVRITFHDDAKHYRTKVTRAAYPDGYRTLDTRIPCDADTCAGTYKVRPDGQRMPDLVCSVDRTHRLDPAVWSRASWQNKTGAA